MIKANDYVWGCSADSGNPWIQIKKTDGGYDYLSGVPTGDMIEHYETKDDIYNHLYGDITAHYKYITSQKKLRTVLYYYEIYNVKNYDIDPIFTYDECLSRFLRHSKINTEIIKILNTYGILVCKFIKKNSPYFIMTHPFFNKNKNKYKLKQIKQLEINKSKKEQECYKVLKNELFDDLITQYEIPKSSGRAYKVDYYSKKKNLCIEFLGDRWHGNPDVFKMKKLDKKLQKTYSELNTETFDRLKFISEKGFNIKYIWENDWNIYLRDKSKNIDTNIKDYLKTYLSNTDIN